MHEQDLVPNGSRGHMMLYIFRYKNMGYLLGCERMNYSQKMGIFGQSMLHVEVLSFLVYFTFGYKLLDILLCSYPIKYPRYSLACYDF